MSEKIKNEPFMEVTYNGEKIPLTYEDSVTLAQKGMNYDKLNEKNTKLSEEIKNLTKINEGLEKIAKKLNISSEELILGLEEESVKEDILSFSKDNNIPFEYAKKLKDMEEKITALEKEKEELIPIKKKNDEISEFKKIYPDIDEREIDPEILKEWEESKRPLKDVYSELTLKKMLKEKSATKSNKENADSSSGSVAGLPEREEEFTDELIRNMSDKEFNKNFTKILKQYKKGDR